MKKRRFLRWLSAVAVPVLALNATAQDPNDAVKSIYQTLAHEGLSTAAKKESLQPSLLHSEETVRAEACFALAVLGDPQAAEHAKRQLSAPSYEVVTQAALCLAMAEGAPSVKHLAQLLGHKEELVRDLAGKLVAQFKNDPVAWAALKQFLQSETQSSNVFNALREMRGWNHPEAVRFLASFLEKAIAKNTFTNAQAIATVLGDAADRDPLAYKRLENLFSNPQRFPGGLMDLGRAMLPTPHVVSGSQPKALAFLETKLSDRKTSPAERLALARAIGDFRSPKSMSAFEKALSVCDSSDCEAIAWIAAEQGEALSRKVLKKALGSKETEVQHSVKGIGIYQKATDKDALVLGAMELFQSKSKKQGFDSVERLTKLLELSSCDKNGVSAETIEKLVLSSASVFPIPGEQMGKCYAIRFGRDTLRVSSFLSKLPTHSPVTEAILTSLVQNPSEGGCRALAKDLAKNALSLAATDAKLRLVGLRLSRKCPFPMAQF